MTIFLHDNQGRDWTVEGDWHGQVVGADFGGNGAILMWPHPDGDGHLEPDRPPRVTCPPELEGPDPALGAGEAD